MDEICSCGRHKGVNSWSPRQRALSYAWHRSRNINYDANRKAFLESWEAHHGLISESEVKFEHDFF